MPCRSDKDALRQAHSHGLYSTTGLPGMRKAVPLVAPASDRWRWPKSCIYLLPPPINNNRRGSTRMGELAQEPRESRGGMDAGPGRDAA